MLILLYDRSTTSSAPNLSESHNILNTNKHTIVTNRKEPGGIVLSTLNLRIPDQHLQMYAASTQHQQHGVNHQDNVYTSFFTYPPSNTKNHTFKDKIQPQMLTNDQLIMITETHSTARQNIQSTKPILKLENLNNKAALTHMKWLY